MQRSHKNTCLCQLHSKWKSHPFSLTLTHKCPVVCSNPCYRLSPSQGLKPNDFRVPSTKTFLCFYDFLLPWMVQLKNQQTNRAFFFCSCLSQTPFLWTSISSRLDLSLIHPSKLCLGFAGSPWQITLHPPLSDPSAKPVGQGLLHLPWAFFSASLTSNIGKVTSSGYFYTSLLTPAVPSVHRGTVQFVKHCLASHPSDLLLSRCKTFLVDEIPPYPVTCALLWSEHHLESPADPGQDSSHQSC